MKKFNTGIIADDNNVHLSNVYCFEVNVTLPFDVGQPFFMCDMFLCRLKIVKGVIISKLFIKVDSSDSSYMPERVIVYGCSSPSGRQHILRETTIPSYDFAVYCSLFMFC